MYSQESIGYVLRISLPMWKEDQKGAGIAKRALWNGVGGGTEERWLMYISAQIDSELDHFFLSVGIQNICPVSQKLKILNSALTLNNSWQPNP